MRPSFAVPLFLSLLACQNPGRPDTSPPRFLGSRLMSPSSLEIAWDEAVVAHATFESRTVNCVVVEGSARLELPPDLVPGQLYSWALSAHDLASNASSVRGTIRGPNDHPAGLRFNEVRLAGNRARGDAVEFVAVAAGNLGGLQLTLWKSAQQHRGWVFPSREVSAGEFVVVRFHPGAEGPGTVYDFPEASGLSGTVGVLVLTGPQEGTPAQTFVWSKRPGEGLALAQRSGVVAPSEEHGVVGCTPTRTWSRQPDGHWIITATGGATLGASNSIKAWIPTPSSPKSTQKPTASASSRDRPPRPSRPSVPDASANAVPDQVRVPVDPPSKTQPGADNPPEDPR